MELPDCPAPGCDAANSLEGVRVDVHGSIWCVCLCCAKECLVKDGRVVHPAPRRRVDTQGNSITGP